MKTKKLLIVVALLFTLALFVNAQRSMPAHQWEYKRELMVYRNGEPTPDVNSRLQALGAEGWELVEFSPEQGSTLWGVYIFKRQR